MGDSARVVPQLGQTAPVTATRVNVCVCVLPGKLHVAATLHCASHCMLLVLVLASVWHSTSRPTAACMGYISLLPRVSSGPVHQATFNAAGAQRWVG